MPYKDDTKRKAAMRACYHKNKGPYLKRAKENNKKYRERNRRFLARFKVFKGCELCGFKTHSSALDCHHIQDKDQKVPTLAGSSVSLARLKTELRKCVILCANCHRLLHAGIVGL